MGIGRNLTSIGSDITRLSVTLQPAQERAYTSLGQRYTGITCAIVDVDGIAVGTYRVSTREHHVVHIASALIVGFRPEDPGIAPQQTNIRLQNVKESEANPV